MIRHRLVVGFRDKVLTERLQLDPELTLEKAKTTLLQKEAVHSQQQVLQEAQSGSLSLEHGSMDVLRSQETRTKPLSGTFTQKPKQTPKQCIKCGKGHHPWYLCPAKDSVCHKCKWKGHFSSHSAYQRQ